MAASTTREDRDILPNNVKPSHYQLKIFDIEFGRNFGYKGDVFITLKVLRATKEIVLNAHQLNITFAEIVNTTNSTNISFDVPRQRVTITLKDTLAACEEALLRIKFDGIINNDMAGFYRSKYEPASEPSKSVPKVGDSYFMFSTQFESCDARRAFPCFDEPNLKATFKLGVVVPDDLVALSNMPVGGHFKSQEAGLHEVWFEQTPIMSTYLLAWAIGDFEYLEGFTKRKYSGKPLPVRVYTTRGLKRQAQYALDHAPQIIDYFSKIFGIDYPLPKADLLAVHEFATGAMENWGLVTYRTTAVLFDEEASDAKFRNRVAYVVAHELAHQWFGNLVTMDWWNELWLNEGFATWAGWLAVDKLHPDWEVWPQFVLEGMQSAFKDDSLRSSHPVEEPVRDAREVDQIFDHISYLKGSSVITMLAADLGQAKFLEGVRHYLKNHAYGNATAKDLWDALTTATGKEVAAFMIPWIRYVGFPIITLTEIGSGILKLDQSRYLSTGDTTPENDTAVWPIPIGVGLKGYMDIPLLDTKQGFVGGVDYSFYKLNKNTTGFYRTKYPPGQLTKIAMRLDKLSVSDKIGLIGDTGALAKSGEVRSSSLLRLLGIFTKETNYLVWSQVLSSLGTVQSIFSADPAIREGLRKFTLSLISPAVEEIGWNSSRDASLLVTRLRSLLLLTAGLNDHVEVVAEAKRRFQLHLQGDTSAITANLREPVFNIVVHSGNTTEYEALKQAWANQTSVDGAVIILGALGRIRNHDLYPDIFVFMTNTVPPQDVHTLAAALSANPATRYHLWTYIKEHFATLHARLAGNMVVWDRFLRSSLADISVLEHEEEITAFFADKDVKGYDRALRSASEAIKANARYEARDKGNIKEWLEEMALTLKWRGGV